jgi:hypothetical protein
MERSVIGRSVLYVLAVSIISRKLVLIVKPLGIVILEG